MSIIAEFNVWSSELTMSETLTAFSGVTLEGVQQVATDPNRPYGLFWVICDELDAFDETLREDETVTEVECYTRLDDRALYRARISERVKVVGYPVWVELGAEQMEVWYADGWWRNRMRFPNRDALAAMEDWCVTNDIEFDLKSVYTDEGDASASGLTDPQCEVLRVAYEQGYFEVPREGTLQDIADELGISTQAASERLRRAYKRLIETL